MIVEEIAEYLTSEGLGTFDATGITGDIFIETMPDSPDVAIGLFTTGGLAPDVSTSVSRPRVQLIVRGGRDPREAAALAAQIYEALHGLRSMEFISGGTRIMLCSAVQSGAIRLGPDDNGRHEYSINLQLITGGD